MKKAFLDTTTALCIFGYPPPGNAFYVGTHRWDAVSEESCPQSTPVSLVFDYARPSEMVARVGEGRADG